MEKACWNYPSIKSLVLVSVHAQQDVSSNVTFFNQPLQPLLSSPMSVHFDLNLIVTTSMRRTVNQKRTAVYGRVHTLKNLLKANNILIFIFRDFGRTKLIQMRPSAWVHGVTFLVATTVATIHSTQIQMRTATTTWSTNVVPFSTNAFLLVLVQSHVGSKTKCLTTCACLRVAQNEYEQTPKVH
jgi:hypothetical protein